jgi:hypothetical protein
MPAVMTGASSFETVRSAPPQDEEESQRAWRLILTLRRAVLRPAAFILRSERSERLEGWAAGSG